MELLKTNAEENVLVKEGNVLEGRIKKLFVIISMAAMSVLGACSETSSMETCLGEDQAEEIQSRLSKMKETCHERVIDYVKSSDGAIRATLRDDAEHACVSLVDEYKVTSIALQTKWDSLRRQKKWDRRDTCKVAKEETEAKEKGLVNGDLKRLREE